MLDSDPRRAAQELLASYKLDERTETLTLFATALSADKQYARALDTWQRIILFRESEIESANEAIAGTRLKKKREEARASRAKAEDASEQAAAEIMKLWPNVARVRVQLPAGEAWTVTAGGMELDTSKDVLVNAGHDELMFMKKGGAAQRVVVDVAAGQIKTIDAPKPEAPMVAMAEKPKAKAVAMAEPQREPEKPIVMAPKPKAEKPAAMPKAKLPEPSVIERPTAAEAMQSDEQERSPRMARIGLGLGAAGIVGLTMAGTVAYLAHRDFDRAKDLGCDSNGQCPVGPAADVGDRAHDRTRFAQISGIGGGALLVTGATMWFLGHKKTHHKATDVTVGVGTNSLAIGWSIQ